MKTWFKSTSLGMWLSNKRNGITILSDKEYMDIIKAGGIRTVIII